MLRRVVALQNHMAPKRLSRALASSSSPGEQITMSSSGELIVPNRPVLPFIEGDGTGKDIWEASVRVFDAAVEKAYGGKRSVDWLEVYAGEKAFKKTGEWLPEATLDAFRKYLVGIKGPLTTPIGGGIRSLNVALRQELDLYVCLRPVRWFTGVPSPVKKPEDVDMVIFRENSEDIYAGIEFAAGSKEASKFYDFLSKELGVNKVRFPNSSGFGIKPISKEGTERLMRAALEFSIEHNKPSLTIVHKGNIMKYTEGAFKSWGYELAKREFRDQIITERESWIVDNKDRGIDSIEENAKGVEPGYEMMTDGQKNDLLAEVEGVLDSIYETHGNSAWKKKLMVKDAIADIALQQVMTRAKEFSVIATMNLNGDYLSDALAAQVGGIGIAPGGNANYVSGHAIFEATHGTAPKYAGLDKVNPSSVILSGVMMFEHLKWQEAADLIVKGLEKSISSKRVTYDFERMMDGATKLKCSEFASEIIKNM